ncbi:MAG: J domain-containing protein [Coriobacteriales bacterium]|nr:J domain-containing protein [Coriobacteriales bacterium]
MTRAEAEQLFGLSSGYTLKDIKTAYLRLAKEFHPDARGNSRAANIFMQQINEANEILKAVVTGRYRGDGTCGGSSKRGKWEDDDQDFEDWCWKKREEEKAAEKKRVEEEAAARKRAAAEAEAKRRAEAEERRRKEAEEQRRAQEAAAAAAAKAAEEHRMLGKKLKSIARASYLVATGAVVVYAACSYGKALALFPWLMLTVSSIYLLVIMLGTLGVERVKEYCWGWFIPSMAIVGAFFSPVLAAGAVDVSVSVPKFDIILCVFGIAQMLAFFASIDWNDSKRRIEFQLASWCALFVAIMMAVTV